MSIENIGTNIARLRKEKGVRQEDLARHTNVSVQAVSKWENGGVPDTLLLPEIAKFFDVSIDALFGIDSISHGDIEIALMNKIAGMPQEKRMDAIFKVCRILQRASQGIGDSTSEWAFSDFEKTVRKIAPKNRIYSTTRFNSGYTTMCLENELPYFFIALEPPNINAALFEGIDYLEFFAMLGNKDVFDAIILLDKFSFERFHDKKPFTSCFFVENLQITVEKAKEIMPFLEKIGAIFTNDGLEEAFNLPKSDETYYLASNTTSFIMFLTLARELLDPNKGSYYGLTSFRNKPYLS